MPFQFKRLQFPVRVAFVMTINKAQGQSLQVCGLLGNSLLFPWATVRGLLTCWEDVGSARLCTGWENEKYRLPKCSYLNKCHSDFEILSDIFILGIEFSAMKLSKPELT